MNDNQPPPDPESAPPRKSTSWLMLVTAFHAIVLTALICTHDLWKPYPTYLEYDEIGIAVVGEILALLILIHMFLGWRRRVFDPELDEQKGAQTFIRETQAALVAAGFILMLSSAPFFEWKSLPLQVGITIGCSGGTLFLLGLVASFLIGLHDQAALTRIRLQFRFQDLLLLTCLWGNSVGWLYSITWESVLSEVANETAARAGWLSFLLVVIGVWLVDGFVWGLTRADALRDINGWNSHWPALILGWSRIPFSLLMLAAPLVLVASMVCLYYWPPFIGLFMGLCGVLVLFMGLRWLRLLSQIKDWIQSRKARLKEEKKENGVNSGL